MITIHKAMLKSGRWTPLCLVVAAPADKLRQKWMQVNCWRCLKRWER